MKGKKEQGWKNKRDDIRRGRDKGEGRKGRARKARGEPCGGRTRGKTSAGCVYVPRLHKLSRETDNVG